MTAVVLFGRPSVLMAQIRTTVWTPVDVTLRVDAVRDWWECPVEAVFSSVESGRELRLVAFSTGPREYTFRFAAPEPGRWTYRVEPDEEELNGRAGFVEAAAATRDEVAANVNLRGHLRVSPNGRYFESADGMPFFLLADTNWAINTARCGLGERGDGPFFEYLADRKRKGFSAILMAYLRGFGDTEEPAGQRNEGGYPFVEGDTRRLNYAYFEALDRRMEAIWRAGLVVAVHPTWFGKRNCFFDHADAVRISSYLSVRYGAYNGLWSLSGEYQYSMKDCGWTADDLNALGEAVQAHNAYHHPLSIHPSGSTNWPAPHGGQSSRAFHASSWLDSHWLQTGQQLERVYNIPLRIAENRALAPARPVFLAEAFYERASDADHAYHARWQAWNAFLNGAAGYGYGAFGMWQFYDLDDSAKETGKKVNDVIPWREAIAFEGSAQVQWVGPLLARYEWWKLRPDPASLMVDGRAAGMPTASDISRPCAASLPGGTRLIYVPRGNASREISIADQREDPAAGSWYDPRTGESRPMVFDAVSGGRGRLPNRPDPADDDWVAVIEASPR